MLPRLQSPRSNEHMIAPLLKNKLGFYKIKEHLDIGLIMNISVGHVFIKLPLDWNQHGDLQIDVIQENQELTKMLECEREIVKSLEDERYIDENL